MPASVEVLTSTDNSVYTSRGTILAANSVSDPGGRRYMYELSANVTARYVRLRITKYGPGFALKSSEIHVAPQGAVQPSAMVGERLVSVTDAIGRKVSYGYDSSGRLTRVVDMLGNAAGQDPSLHTWTYAYDGLSNHISSITDPDGRVAVANTYDALGRLDTQKDGLLNTTNFDYAGGQVIITDPRLHVSTQTFDARNRMLSQQDTVGANTFTLSFTYDGCGNRDSATDRRGKLTTFTYDCAGNLRHVVAPSLAPPAPGFETNYDYDLRNNLIEVVDARAFVTTNTYDPVTNALLSTTQQITTAPDTFAVTKLQYTDATNPGLPTRIISPRGNTTGTPDNTYSQVLEYYPTGELLRRTDADGNKTTFTYDGVSRQQTMVDPDGNALGGVPSQHTWTTVYDANDRVTQVTDPLGHSSFTSYDGAGNTATVTDRNGNITVNIHDDAARLWKVKQKPDPIGAPTLEYITTVLRDLNGNATQVTQANGVVTNYDYDALNRLISVTSHPGAPAPANLTTSYVLDGNGNTEKRTSGDGVETIYTYDNMSRLKTVAAPSLAIGYDYDELSRRVSMTDVTGASTYTYDGLGRLTQAVQPNGTLGYGYDLDSNRETLTYPSVGSVTYDFTPAGRMWRLTDWASRQSLYTYFASGLTHTVSLPAALGGLTTTYEYDEAQRLESLVNSTTAGTVSSHVYTLNNEGNRTAIDEVIGGGAPASVKVNSDTGTTVQDHAEIAIGADNAAYLIWDDVRDGNANIYFDRRDPVTGLWGTTDVKVNSESGTRIQLNPAISTDSASNAYAVWQDERNGAGKADIFYRKRNAAGTWVAPPDVKVSDEVGGGGGSVQRNPRIAGKADGAQTAVWVDLRSSQNNIYSSTLPVGGAVWAVNKKVTDNAAALKDFPDVVVGSDGTSHAVWQDSRGGNADIYYATLASGGGTWLTPNVKISDDPGSAAQSKPRIGIDNAGNLTAVWLDARTSPTKVRAARKPAGGAWSASIEISPTPASAQSVALAVRPDGYAWATWGDIRAGASNSDIWASRYDPYLNSWSAPQRLDDATGTSAQLNPAVAFTVGETMLAWRDNRLSANGDTQARRVVFAPGLVDHFALVYDGLNRLKSVSGPVPESFVLDQASNIDTRTGPTQDFGYDGANRITGLDGNNTYYQWTNADQLDLRGTDNFDYDALDRMKLSTVAGTTRTYAYNGDGLLKSRTQGAATQFLWDPSSSPSRLLKHGADNIIYGLGPLYVVKADATTLTFARDGSKNVRAEVSSGGSVAAAFRFGGYGQTAQSTAASPSYLGLASQLIDPSGLYYMRARWYDPSTGRFISRDPIRGVPGLPATLNSFSYAAANPIMLSDPSGLLFSSGGIGSGECVGDCRPDTEAVCTADSSFKCNIMTNRLGHPNSSPTAQSTNICARTALGTCALMSSPASAPTPPSAPATPPSAADKKLRNIIANLYKGVGNPARVGDGTTMDAIRNEIRTGQPTQGTWHISKGYQTIDDLVAWVDDAVGASPGDVNIAENLLRQLLDALGRL